MANRRRLDQANHNAIIGGCPKDLDAYMHMQKYISHVQMHPNESIRAVSRDTTVFERLLTEWKFKPGDKPNTCEINFFIDFKFSNLLYAQVSTIFFDEVVKEMVSAFEKRCEEVEENI